MSPSFIHSLTISGAQHFKNSVTYSHHVAFLFFVWLIRVAVMSGVTILFLNHEKLPHRHPPLVPFILVVFLISALPQPVPCFINVPKEKKAEQEAALFIQINKKAPSMK